MLLKSTENIIEFILDITLEHQIDIINEKVDGMRW